MKQMIILTGLVSIFLMMCDNSTGHEHGCSPLSDPSKEIEIIYPAGSDQLQAGETINIQWKVVSKKVSKVNLSVSIDNGIIYDDLFSTMMVPGDQETACMSVDWEVGKLNNNSQIVVKDTTLILMISDYDDGESYDLVSVRVKK